VVATLIQDVFDFNLIKSFIEISSVIIHIKLLTYDMSVILTI
jgi:hypothetical protein